MKERELLLLDAIAEDETVTQAGLAAGLGMAVGSVNWYIKRLISRGYLKATRMDRTRLRYNLTSEGMSVLARRATQYMRDSLELYGQLRESAKETLIKLESQGVKSVYLQGDDAAMDIMRLTCIERQITLDTKPENFILRYGTNSYELVQVSS
jgi:DNA-binding MarR family transcriptional regulator